MLKTISRKILVFGMCTFFSYWVIMSQGIKFTYTIGGLKELQTPLFFYMCFFIGLSFIFIHSLQKNFKFTDVDILLFILFSVAVYGYFLLIKVWPLTRFIFSAALVVGLTTIKRDPDVFAFFSSKTPFIFVLLLLVLGTRDPVIFLSLSFICLNVLISHTQWYSNMIQTIIIDLAVINHHWKEDSDLRFFWKLILFFFLVQMLVSIKIILELLNLADAIGSEGLEIVFKNKSITQLAIFWVLIFVTSNLLILLGNLYVIWFRNMPVREKIFATCVTCVKFSIVTATATGGVAVGMSYIPACDPNPIGNAYQIRFGRGYGFETFNAQANHHILMSKPLYRKMLPNLLMDTKMITDESIDKAMACKSLNDSLSITQRQLLKR